MNAEELKALARAMREVGITHYSGPWGEGSVNVTLGELRAVVTEPEPELEPKKPKPSAYAQAVEKLRVTA